MLSSKPVDSVSVVNKCEQYSDSSLESPASTITPPSPEILPTAIDATSWPSLREAEHGWDFCSEASADEDWVEDIEIVSSNVQVVPATLESGQDIASTPSFADVLRSMQAANDLSSSARVRSCDLAEAPSDADKLVRKKNTAKTVKPAVDVIDDPIHWTCAPTSRGWEKQHKASWNTKSQKKLAEKVARRVEQSCRARAWLEA